MTTFFDKFDLVNYDFSIPTDSNPILETMVNFLQRVKLNISDKDIDKICDLYILGDNTKPEQVAAALYNDPYLHWTILYINNISDVISQWPINENALSAFVTRKYGSGNEYNTHHYELENTGVWVDPPIYDLQGSLISNFAQDVYGVTPILNTNYDYENQLNELKRNIKVIKPEYISAFVDLFSTSLQSQSVLGD